MSLKEVIDLLNDLKESHKQIALRLKLLELELISLKQNILGRIANMIEKTEKIDKKVSQNYINNLLAKKFARKNSYKKGSMDEKLIQDFLEKNKEKEIESEKEISEEDSTELEEKFKDNE